MSKEDLNEKLNETPEQVKPELSDEQKKKLEEAKLYYSIVRSGQVFLEFVMKDLNNKVNSQYNRAERRRMQKDLKKGILSEEVITLYADRIDEITKYLGDQLEVIKKASQVDKTE